ncbi:MAG TPA: FecR family protein [Methylosinus sp.]|jgi:transmembrane sensor|uniref:FecR family protein n=1 Tax=Methylosinus sp. TaxID=427 RepID=UPI002F920220
MNENDRSRKEDAIYRTAGAWWVKVDGRSLSREDRAAFDAWLAADPFHRTAFDEVSSICDEAQTLEPWPVDAPEIARRPRKVIAAAALLAASLASFLCFDELSLLWQADYRTGTAESRSITLEDGSRVELSARSAVAVNFTGAERRLSLLAGEAFFQAAPDRARPFVVAAASGTVTALGTAFDIALKDGEARVAVAEHRVAVASGGRSEVVGEGQQSIFGPAAAITAPAAVDIDRATGWRRGKLIFVDRPLGEVVAVLSRYHRGYIVVPGAATRRLSVTGVFDVGDPLGALAEIERSLDLRPIYLTNYLVFLRE